MKVRKAVIPAAGLGTRFLPATKTMPKEMLPIVDKPIIQYVVEEAVASGIDDILIITGRGKRAIEDYFDRSIELEQHLEHGAKEELLQNIRGIAEMVNVHFIRQKVALGLGHAVLHARQHVGNEPFAVLLGDEIFVGQKPCLRELMDNYEQVGGGGIVAVKRVPTDQVHRYGIVDCMPTATGSPRINAMVEKPTPEMAPSNLAIIGRYIISPQIFDILDYTRPGLGGEIQLTDALNELARLSPVYACEPEAVRYDVGNKVGYLEATLDFALRRDDLRQSVVDIMERLLEATPRGI